MYRYGRSPHPTQCFLSHCTPTLCCCVTTHQPQRLHMPPSEHTFIAQLYSSVTASAPARLRVIAFLAAGRSSILSPVRAASFTNHRRAHSSHLHASPALTPPCPQCKTVRHTHSTAARSHTVDHHPAEGPQPILFCRRSILSIPLNIGGLYVVHVNNHPSSHASRSKVKLPVLSWQPMCFRPLAVRGAPGRARRSR